MIIKNIIEKNIKIIIAYVQLNIKMLFKDKLSFLWSIILPIFFVFYNQKDIVEVTDLGGYQIYIVFSAYIYGVVLHSINIKETGCLKTFFSIKQTKFDFFLANLITQIIFSLICLVMLDLYTCILLHISFWKLVCNSIILIIAGIPIPFLFFVITLVEKLKYQVANTLFTIMITICLMTLGVESPANCFNPLYVYMKVLYISSKVDTMLYILFSMFSIMIGCYAITKYRVLSSEVR